MKKFALTGLLLAVCFFFSYAQEETDILDDLDYSELAHDFLEEVGAIPESLDANVDSLMHSWHVKYFTKADYCLDDDRNVEFPDSIYMERLARLPHVIPMTYNRMVRNSIELFTEKRRTLIRYVLGMSDYYFPIFEQILDEYGLPQELKYLPVIESALNPVALSRVGASGIWQFMLPTAKSYGLEVNSLVDERRDPVQATHAACRYFVDSYNTYGDWHLAIAAYNCGVGAVNRAIRRANGKRNFWDIYPYLPRETRSYVPLFIAAAYVMNYYCDHNICPVHANLPLASDTVMVSRMLHLEQVADALHLDIDLLQAMNPQYKLDILPGNIEPMPLKLPAMGTFAFAGNEDSVYAHRYEELLADCKPIDLSGNGGIPASRRQLISHTVKTGETLYTIANQYGVEAKNIRQWNGLGSNRVARGVRLRVYIDNGGIDVHSLASTPPPKASTATAQTSTTTSGDGYVTYTVKSGDTLSGIARQYSGVTVRVIQDFNGLSGTTIRAGQKLKIPNG